MQQPPPKFAPPPRPPWHQFHLWEVALFVAGALIIGGIAGFIIGVELYVHSQCLVYPFLFLDPHQYVACKLP